MDILEHDAAALHYLGDDLIVMDPPYNIGYPYAGEFTDKMTPEQYAQLFNPMRGLRVVCIHYVEAIYEHLAPVLGYPEHVAAWVYNSNLRNRSWRAVAWWNCLPDWEAYRVPYRDMGDRRVRELAARTGGRALPNWWEVNLVKNCSAEKIEEYTNQIPTEVVRRILKTTAKPGDTIVDPFCGTGTTLAVADQLGLPFRGYDINPLAIELSTRRLKLQRDRRDSELPLFENENTPDERAH